MKKIMIIILSIMSLSHLANASDSQLTCSSLANKSVVKSVRVFDDISGTIFKDAGIVELGANLLLKPYTLVSGIVTESDGEASRVEISSANPYSSFGNSWISTEFNGIGKSGSLEIQVNKDSTWECFVQKL